MRPLLAAAKCSDEVDVFVKDLIIIVTGCKQIQFNLWKWLSCQLPWDTLRFLGFFVCGGRVRSLMFIWSFSDWALVQQWEKNYASASTDSAESQSVGVYHPQLSSNSLPAGRGHWLIGPAVGVSWLVRPWALLELLDVCSVHKGHKGQGDCTQPSWTYFTT